MRSADFAFCTERRMEGELIWYRYVDHRQLGNQTLLPQVNESKYQSEVFNRRNTTLLRAVLKGIWEGESAAVVVFGGSETAGHGCGQPGYTEQRCAWSGRLFKWLEAASNNSRLQFLNVARGGTTSVSTLPVIRFMLQEIVRGQEAKHHLVLLDFGVNDAVENRDVGKYKMNVPTAIAQAMEHLFVQVWDALPRAAIVVVGYPRSWMPTGAYEKVAAAYGVPSLPLLKHKRGLADHPPAAGHVWVANVIVHGMAGLVCEALDNVQGRDPPETYRLPPQAGHSEQFLEPALAARMPLCQNPLSSYSAYRHDAPTRMEGNCSLTEDRPGKPGYICLDKTSFMSFNLSFGRDPRLLVSYLRSYQGISSIAAKMLGTGTTNILSGNNYMKVSQVYVAFIFASFQISQNYGAGNGHQGFGVRPHSNRTLVLRSTQRKIKVVSVISC